MYKVVAVFAALAGRARRYGIPNGAQSALANTISCFRVEARRRDRRPPPHWNSVRPVLRRSGNSRPGRAWRNQTRAHYVCRRGRAAHAAELPSDVPVDDTACGVAQIYWTTLGSGDIAVVDGQPGW